MYKYMKIPPLSPGEVKNSHRRMWSPSSLFIYEGSMGPCYESPYDRSSWCWGEPSTVCSCNGGCTMTDYGRILCMYPSVSISQMDTMVTNLNSTKTSYYTPSTLHVISWRQKGPCFQMWNPWDLWFCFDEGVLYRPGRLWTLDLPASSSQVLW